LKTFKGNIKLNKIPNGIIRVENLAITGDGRTVNMHIDMINSEGSGVSKNCDTDSNYLQSSDMQSVTLEDVFKKLARKSCKLLKIDCEWSEYEILYNTQKDILQKCEYIRGEFHEDGYIRAQGYSASASEQSCKSMVKNVDVFFYYTR
jgi:FkbM family methyltransferase